jgi:hypothetical protein
MRHDFDNYFVAPKEYFSGQRVNTIILIEYVTEEWMSLQFCVWGFV